jgi:hypothetical protein
MMCKLGAEGPKTPIPDFLEHRQDFCATEKPSIPEILECAQNQCAMQNNDTRISGRHTGRRMDAKHRFQNFWNVNTTFV